MRIVATRSQFGLERAVFTKGVLHAQGSHAKTPSTLMEVTFGFLGLAFVMLLIVAAVVFLIDRQTLASIEQEACAWSSKPAIACPGRWSH